MIQYWWKDLFDRNNNWQGLEPTLKSSQRTDVAMEMLSGRYGRMALQVSGETLFWASMLKDHSGVWLVPIIPLARHYYRLSHLKILKALKAKANGPGQVNGVAIFPGN
jgi:hypothetical protein